MLPCCIHCCASLSRPVVLTLAPYCFHSCALLFSFSSLTTFAPYYFCFCALLLSLLCLVVFVFTPCYSHLLLVPWCSRLHILVFSLTCLATHTLFSLSHPTVLFEAPFGPPLLLCCVATCYCALLFYLAVGNPSPFSCVGGGTWTNTNKLHPTIKVFFFLDFLSFFFFALYFVCLLCFCLSIFF